MPRAPKQLTGVTVKRTSPVPSSSRANLQWGDTFTFRWAREWLNPSGTISFVFFAPSFVSATNSTLKSRASLSATTGGTVIVIGNAPGSGGRMSRGPGGRPGGEGSLSVSGDLVKTQTSSKGLSSGNHTVTVGGTTISYQNAYSYSGYVTVYAAAAATVD